MSINRVTLIGNVGKDPEIRTFDNGGKIASFSLATSESYTNKNGEKVTNTEWHNISANNKLADVVEKWITKGMQLYIEGSIRYREYEDKEGNKKYMTEIRAYTIQMLGKKLEGQSNNEPAQQPTDENNDLPF